MNITVETPACPMCGRSTQLTVDQNKYEQWRGGELIQRVWPEWSASQRELLITGTHDECWERMFPDEEEDEDQEVPVG